VDDARARLLVGSGLSQLPYLSHVDMSFNVISDVGTRAIASLVSQCSSLTTVTLVDNNIRPSGARALAHGLAADTCQLHSLDLRLNYISDEGALELCRVLTRRNRTLTRLNISSNLCTSAAASALADMLSHNDVISSVDVTCNNLAVSVITRLCLSVCLSVTRSHLIRQSRHRAVRRITGPSRALSSRLFQGEYETVRGTIEWPKATSRGTKRRAGEWSGEGSPLGTSPGMGVRVSPPG